MAKFSPPDQFDFSSPESWLSWKQRFTRFRTISKLDTDSEERQVSTLLYTMGPRAESVMDQLTFDSDADSMKWSKVAGSILGGDSCPGTVHLASQSQPGHYRGMKSKEVHQSGPYGKAQKIARETSHAINILQELLFLAFMMMINLKVVKNLRRVRI